MAHDKTLVSLIVTLGTIAAIGACESGASDGAGGSGGSNSPGGSAGKSSSAGGSSAGGAVSGNGGTNSAGNPSGAAAGQIGSGASGGTSAGDGGTGAVGDGGTNTDGGMDAAGGEAGQASTGREFAYVSSRFNGGGVRVASIDRSSGRLDVLPNAPVASRGVVALAVESTQRFVYVADEVKHIETYRIAEDGSLPAQPASSVELSETVATLALDPKARFAYATTLRDFNEPDRGGAVHTFKIDAETGALTASGQPLQLGKVDDGVQPAFLALDPTGTFAYISLTGEIGLRGYRVDPTTGTLAKLPDSPFPDTIVPEAAGVFAGGIVFSPSGDFLYTAGGALNAFSIEKATGNLALVQGSPFTREIQSDPGAPNISIDPKGKYLYVTKFSFSNIPPSVSGFEINQTTGALTAVPGSPIRDATSFPYSLAVNPSGTFLLVAQDFGQVAVSSIKRSTGAFAEVEGSRFTLGGLEPKIAFATRP